MSPPENVLEELKRFKDSFDKYENFIHVVFGAAFGTYLGVFATRELSATSSAFVVGFLFCIVIVLMTMRKHVFTFMLIILNDTFEPPPKITFLSYLPTLGQYVKSLCLGCLIIALVAFAVAIVLSKQFGMNAEFLSLLLLMWIVSGAVAVGRVYDDLNPLPKWRRRSVKRTVLYDENILFEMMQVPKEKPSEEG